MESSSSSSLKWDIFVSCRGDRTSNSFISQLQAALMEKKNKTIIEYELTRGYNISSSLLKAIEESRVFIIIFMEDYVFNTRCVEELVKILEWKEMYGQIVIQVCYGIYPPDWIKNMTFEFAIHLQVFGENSNKLRRLSDAFKEAAARYKQNIIDSVPYCIHVEDIVQDIFKRSTNMSSTDDEDLVGINSKIRSFSSISNSTPQFKYDVFLSFRGEDTRYNFISHLHAALSKKNIKIFVDNQLRKGDEISPSLLTAIKESRISIVVFSKDYASSTWCLQELVKILECREMYGQIVIPVFHGIYASDVRKQTDTFSDAFAKHEQVFGYKSEKLQRWKTALTKAANLSGWDSSVIRVEYVLVNKIVKDVLGKLEYLSSITELVGIESKVNLIESSLCTGSNDVRAMGICGIGGIGKTILAEAVYNKIACQFEGSYFFDNVRARSKECGGLWRLKDEFLSIILGGGNVSRGHIYMGDTFTMNRFGRKKLLIVFDDVPDSDDTRDFIKYFCGLNLRNRIIITTRVMHVLRRVDQIYQVNELFHDEALKLFSRCAFKQNHPPVEYMELSNKIVLHTGRVPLALTVLGSMLREREKPEWETVLSKITRIIDRQTYDVLKLSYDELSDILKPLFLDIACFFVGEAKETVMHANGICMYGFVGLVGLDALMGNSLLTVSKNKIEMHNLIQAMGREIVRTESIENPARRSRLWHHEDIYSVLKRNTGTDAVEGISLDMSKIKNIQLDPGAFSKMRNLRFLKFYSSANEMNSKVHLIQGTELPSSELSYFYWHAYPLKSLPSNFYPGKLCVLHLPYSNLEQLPDDKHFENLTSINLSHSKLTKIPDIPVAPSLESLILEGCNNLLEIPSSIGHLDKLVTLNLRDCKSLKSLPNYIHLKSLKILVLSGCSNLNKFPEMLGNIQELYLGGTIIEELPSSIEHLSCLVILDLENCSMLTCLPNGIGKLKRLEELNLTGCSKLGRLPDDLGNLKALKKLKVSGTGVREMPSSIACLINSGTLSFERCQGQELMGLQLSSLSGLYDLTNLVLSGCNIKELPESLGSLSSVKMLSLCRNNFESIPASIINLSNLILLNISYCERLKSLPILPRDLKLVAHNCTSLEAFSGLTVPFTRRPYTLVVDFINCFRLQQNVLGYLVDHALNRIQFTSIVKHRPSAVYTELDEESDDEMPNVLICYPGNEVPEWFTFRSTKSFVIVKHLPQGWFSDNFVGLAICAVVAFQDHYDDGRGLVLVCECKFRSEDGYSHVVKGYFIGWGNDNNGTHYVGLDHVFLGCDFVMCPGNFGEYYYTNKFYVKFYIEDYSSERMHDCEVKKCGVRLIYRHEFGKPILSTSSDEDYICKYLEEPNGSFCADLHIEEEILHGPYQKSSKLSASFKNRMQIKWEGDAMKQSLDNSSGPKIPSVSIFKEVSNAAWGKAGSFYHASSDASLFSSSLPVLPHEKLNLSGVDLNHQSVDDISSGGLGKVHPGVEGNDSLEDVGGPAIGTIHPDDEDELLAGIMDDFDQSGLPASLEDLEEYDLFGSGGGMELESDSQESLSLSMAKVNLSDGVVGNGMPGLSNGVGTVAGEHPYGEHPSRTLFVWNINSNVEDSELKALFEDELMLSSETRLLERVSGGDIQIQALWTSDHLKRGCVGGKGEQRLVELEDTEQVNNNMRRESNEEKSNSATSKRVEEYSIEECMQMIEELEVDDDAFAKLMEKIVSLEWRKIFLNMSEKRRKTWVQRL